MTCLDIIKKYLVDNNFDGMAHQATGCGCSVDDLAPCGECNVEECQPARKVPCGDGEFCGHDDPTSDGMHYETVDIAITEVKP